MSKKTIIAFVIVLAFVGLFSGSLNLWEFSEDEKPGQEQGLLAFLDPWSGTDIDQVPPTPPTPPDAVKPQVEISYPVDGTEFSASEEAITVKVKASDDSGGVMTVIQNLDPNGKVRQTYAVKDGTVTNFALHTGLNTLLALAKDGAGNVSTHFVIVNRADAATTPSTPTTPPPAPESTPPPATTPPPEPTPPAEPTVTRGNYRDGEYEGTGYYAFGADKFPLTVRLTIINGWIEKLEYLALPKSDLVKDESFLDPMKSAVLSNQTSEVDVISGATGTSEAFLTAVREAVGQAK